MSLVEYRKKRDFKKTAEPAGKVAARRAAKLSFVVQKHAATRLHYDFRLELDGVLKSWAVPKGPAFDPAEKRLAVEVEDHPLEYAKFEGRIPAGEYGAGEVIVWDRGTWTPDGDPHVGLFKGKLEFELVGEKLRGRWVLVRLHGRRERRSDKPNWLLIKRDDELARPLAEFDVVEKQPRSVITGRRLEELRSKNPSQNRQRGGQAHFAPSTAQNEPVPDGSGVGRGSMPALIDVQLASLTDTVPEGENWLYEIKLDGYRMIARLSDGKAALITRRQQDWTHRYRSIAKAVESLSAESAIMDGELVAVLKSGVSSFQALQNTDKPGSDTRLMYYAFDLLYLDGYDLRTLPLARRKERLNQLLKNSPRSPIAYCDHLEGNGEAFFSESCQLGLEGIISKRSDRPYVAGRSGDWVKVKCLGREELVIGGFTLSTAERRGIGALIVGYFDGERLIYAGRVGTGFDSKTLVELRRRLEKTRIDRCPFAAVPSKERGPTVKWVRPELVAEVQFTAWTDEGILRHPSFQGLREDKAASEVVKPTSLKKGYGEAAMARSRTARPGKKQKQRTTAAAVKDAGKDSELPIAITHPERVLFPETGLTKLGLAQYYAQIAEWILPHLVDRPLSLVRCPQGYAQGKCFYQKHAGPGTAKSLGRVRIAENDGPEEYLYVRDVESLLALVQMSVLEIHPWGAKRDHIERPDRLTFDLDPGADVPWKRVVEAAFAVRDLLEDEYSLTSFLKTTGGKGLHVVVPIAPRRYDWDTVKKFCKGVAARLAQGAPDQYTTNMAKAARKGKIFVDYLRNDRGATAVAAYSTRARSGAPVSTPLAWEELSPAVRSDHFRVENLPARLAAMKRDPWEGIGEVRQGLKLKSQ